jgi:hypothetical protein
LIDIVVKFPGDPTTLLFLCLNQLSAHAFQVGDVVNVPNEVWTSPGLVDESDLGRDNRSSRAFRDLDSVQVRQPNIEQN